MKYPLLLMLLITTQAAAKVYKWVDEQGKVHYSDTPIEGAEVVKLKSHTHNKMVLPKAINRSVTQQPEAIQYQLQIDSPSSEATIRDNNGDFTVTASMTPPPPFGSKFKLILDGQPWGVAQTDSLFQLKQIDRGEHSIAVQAIAANGKVLATTPSRVIYLHRAITRVPRPQPRSN